MNQSIDDGSERTIPFVLKGMISRKTYYPKTFYFHNRRLTWCTMDTPCTAITSTTRGHCTNGWGRHAVDEAADVAGVVSACVAVGGYIAEVLGQVVGAAVGVLIVPRRGWQGGEGVTVGFWYRVHVFKTQRCQIWSRSDAYTVLSSI